ncbi:protein-L-isoaspartate(D-aspartate) O-methyltransferase [candidate division KSB1 bacterium]|nr:protein-L-isoaspartate(D-aspartate) O-methyltransferase [candidate division KSB1 bacterium]RQW09466.1 MAG: protein-L-isoaspartate(D-aspartate) O-methyltransferase [candidate division KSB1 bacterium]
MVEQQIVARGVTDGRIIAAMRSLPREKFVPSDYADRAYEDYPLPIGHNQTISQPYIVAYMTEILQLDGSEKVLEIGTGSGYQAAVLGECAKTVYSMEIVTPLCIKARELLAELGYQNVHVRCGDGYAGWPEEAPFDAIIVTAAPTEVPQTLVEQLANNGRMVLPVGKFIQNLLLIGKDANGLVSKEKLIAVRFVPMTGGE